MVSNRPGRAISKSPNLMSREVDSCRLSKAPGSEQRRQIKRFTRNESCPVCVWQLMFFQQIEPPKRFRKSPVKNRSMTPSAQANPGSEVIIVLGVLILGGCAANVARVRSLCAADPNEPVRYICRALTLSTGESVVFAGLSKG